MRDDIEISRLKRLAELRALIIENPNSGSQDWRINEIQEINKDRKKVLDKNYKTLNLRDEIEDFADRLRACGDNGELRKLYMKHELPVLAVAISCASSGASKTRLILNEFKVEGDAVASGFITFSPISYLIYQILSINIEYAAAIPRVIQTISDAYLADPIGKDDEAIDEELFLFCEISENGKDARQIKTVNETDHTAGLAKLLSKLEGGIVKKPEKKDPSSPVENGASSRVEDEEARRERIDRIVYRTKKTYQSRHQTEEELAASPLLTLKKIRNFKNFEQLAQGFKICLGTTSAYEGEGWKVVWDELKARMMELIEQSKPYEKSDVISAIMQGKAVGGCGFDNQTARSLRKLANYHDRWSSYLAAPIKYTACWNTLKACSKKLVKDETISGELESYITSHRDKDQAANRPGVNK